MHQVLYKFGFGFVWKNQGVQNPETFIKAFKQRLIDCHSQNWHEHISNSTRFTIYRMFKISISLEPYFTSVTNKHIRDVLIRFRIGASNIRTHKLRYVAHTPGDLMCPLCNTAYEDEMHTLVYWFLLLFCLFSFFVRVCLFLSFFLFLFVLSVCLVLFVNCFL